MEVTFMFRVRQRVIELGVVLVFFTALAARGEVPQPPSERQQERLRQELQAALDVFERGRRWKESDSALLAWSCGQQMQTLVELYQATGDQSWLDRLFRYAETMFDSLTPNRDGFLSWRSRGYSPAFMSVERAATNKSNATMAPRELWIRDPAVRRQIKDGIVHLRVLKDQRLEWKAEKNAQPASIRYEVGKPLEGPFGIRLTFSAQPAEGDRFLLTTRQPKDFDFAVHDGVILTPICRAIGLVKKERALHANHGQRADKLLRVIETQLIPKWDKSWRETKDGGVYVFQDDPAFVPRNTTLPHNQYLALGTVQVLLSRITGKAAYLERAAKMASFFKSRLRLVKEYYQWNYWDAAGPWDREESSRAEDTGHGSLDIGFVLACVDSAIVFTDADLRRFAKTFTEVMWNGSLDQPTVGGWVNARRTSRQSGNLQNWLELGRWEPKVSHICERLIPAEGSLWAKAQLYRLWRGKTGDRSTPRAKDRIIEW
jgi:hypothetical protein